MSDTASSPPSPAAPPPTDEGLQLERFEPAAGEAAVDGGMSCHYCKQPLVREFWELNGHPSCESCQVALSRHFAAPIPWSIWGRVTLWGGGAALIGTLVYFAVLKLTGYELGLIAIGVGLLVGGAVRRASGYRGGWKLQAAAMAFTYASIVSAYMPSVYEGFVKASKGDASKNAPASDKDKPQAAAPAKVDPPGGTPAAAPSPSPAAAPSGATAPVQGPAASAPPAAETAAPPAATATAAERDAPTAPKMGFGKMLLSLLLAGLLLFLFSAAAPILAGFQNFMGWIIISFALYEAWKLNRRPPLLIRGPLPLHTPAEPSADSPVDPPADPPANPSVEPAAS